MFDKNNHVFIIAELSANHNGSLNTALATIKAAKRSGADAIKLQTYTADTITINAKTDDFKIKQGTDMGWEVFIRFIQGGLYSMGMAPATIRSSES